MARFGTPRQFKEVNTNAIHDERSKTETGVDNRKKSDSATPDYSNGKPPHLTHEDVEALRQSIEEGKLPVKFDSPLEPDECQKQ